MTHCQPSNELRRARTHQRSAAMTYWVLGHRLVFILAMRSATAAEGLLKAETCWPRPERLAARLLLVVARNNNGYSQGGLK